VAIIKLLNGEVLDAIISTLNLQFGTVALVMSLLASVPTLDVLGIHHLSFLYNVIGHGIMAGNISC
jgi:hypothetical protein